MAETKEVEKKESKKEVEVQKEEAEQQDVTSGPPGVFHTVRVNETFQAQDRGEDGWLLVDADENETTISNEEFNEKYIPVSPAKMH